VGVRHILQDEPDDNFMLQDKFINGLRILQRFNLVYDLLIFPKHLPYAIKLVAQTPGTRFVLDHLAKPFIKKKLLSPWQEEIAELAKFPNVWCKVSGMVTEADWHNWKFEDFVPYLDTVFGAFGPNRVLIGSDWPVCTLAGSYQQVVSIVTQYLKKYTAVQQESVLGGNAVKVYRLQIKP
jgi:L-fuconolactonase